MRHPFKILLCVSLFLIMSAGHRPAYAQTLSLDSCLALARSNNAEIRISQMDIENAREVKKQVFTKYFPQVNLAALGYWAVNPIVHFGLEDIQSNDMRELLEALYDLVSVNSDVQNEVSLMKQGASGSATLTQPLYAGGRIATGNKLANLGVEAAELQSEMKERDILENIESTYYLVTGLQEKVATVTAALTLLDSLDRVVQSALDNGLVTRSDALQLQLKRNEMLANHQQLASGIRLSKRLLCCQIGIDYSDNLVFTEEPVSPLSFHLSPSSSHLSPSTSRPEKRLLELSVEAEQLQKRLTLGETLPQLAIVGTGFYGNLIKNDASANAVGFLSLSVPLSGWWETSHKMKQHNIRIAEARIKQEHYNQMMSLEEEKAYSDMLDAAMLMQSDSTALEIAQENYRLATLNYQAGMSTLSEVLEAHALLLQAQNAITDRHTSYVLARRRLMDLSKSYETH